MAEDDTIRTPKFTIRRLQPSQDESPATPTSAPKPSAAGKPEPPAEASPSTESDRPPRRRKQVEPKSANPVFDHDHTAGLFAGARSALAFLGAAFSASRQAGEAAVRRSPKHAWWAEVNAPPDRLAQLVFAAGGTPYAPVGHHWVALTPAGTMPETPPEALDVSGWPVLDLASLLAETALPTARYSGASILEVLIPGAAGPWTLRRAAALGIEAEIAQASVRSLGVPDASPCGRLHVRLRAPRDKVVPAAFVHSLGVLPYVAVCESSDEIGDAGRLLVDVRCRLPLPAPLLHAMVPEEHTWILAPKDVGHWHLSLEGAFVDAASLFDAAPEASVQPVHAPPVPRLPDPIPVRVVAKRGLRRRVDAVLLDDGELDWLRRFLVGRPVSEQAWLLPGDGRHLVTSPGGLPEAVPFGTPLAWIGPGPIYIEMGADLDPPLPEAARLARFRPDDNAVVAILRSGAWRFDPEHLLPAWILWVGQVPKVKTGLSASGKRLVAQIDDHLSRAVTYPPPHRVGHAAPIDQRQRTRLIERAQRAELKGDLVQAAELLEQAGLYGPAGRLFERASGGTMGGD